MNPFDEFEFSQSSLQDFVDCRRRFQLRYLMRVAWPAVQAEPARENELNIQRGERFHRLVQQYLLGIPKERLGRMASADPDGHLHAWWENFLEMIPDTLNGARHVEVALSAPLAGRRLIAKYDLVLVQPGGQATIYDWKTSAPHPRRLHRPKRGWLSERLQTRIYPYLLVTAGAALNGGQPFSPENVRMIYWFADPQLPPETFTYSRAQWEEDRLFLQSLVNELVKLASQDFTLATNEIPCRYCVYRSLCNRGVKAGELDGENQPEFSDSGMESLDFTLEQIGEISF